jgi:hypothetical protein
MANHTTLPIYAEAYKLLKTIVETTKNMPREFKQSIGSTLRDECVQIAILIFRANVAADKSNHLIRLVERLGACELLLRLSRDMRLISTGQYANLIQLTSSIGKQANGWRRSASSVS